MAPEFRRRSDPAAEQSLLSWSGEVYTKLWTVGKLPVVLPMASLQKRRKRRPLKILVSIWKCISKLHRGKLGDVYDRPLLECQEVRDITKINHQLVVALVETGFPETGQQITLSTITKVLSINSCWNRENRE